MKRILTLAIILIVSTAAYAQGYRWHLGSDKDEVAYGIPESDDRLFRLRCLPGGRIEVSGPLSAEDDDPDVREGAQARVMVKTGQTGGQRNLGALVEERGDGWNYVAKVDRDHPVVVALLANKPVHVLMGKYGGEIPTQGAGRFVKRLLENCGTGKK